jgi:hypothetical protein
VSNNKALSAGGLGGGIGNAGNGPVTIIRSTISGNFAGATGGGFGDENGQGALTVLDSVFSGNTAVGNGGGIAVGSPVTSITSSEIDGNFSGGDGGGIFANGTSLFVRNSTLANNTANDGAGIELETTGTGLFHGSTITNTTLTGNLALNNAGSNGGGLDMPAAFTGDVKLQNDTIDANTATTGGGIFWAGVGNVGVENTIVANNFASTAPDVSATATKGVFLDLGGNLIGAAGAAAGNTAFTDATTQTGTMDNPLDPMLGALRNNGGPKIGAPSQSMTLQTQAPLAGSPAIGNGILTDAPVTDARGLRSVVNGKISVGAVSQASMHADAIFCMPFALLERLFWVPRG